jgi:MFS family permease
VLPFVHVGGSPDLRRAELALLGFGVAEWATWIAMLIYAFHIGGAAATGLVALVQLAPSALVAPLASSIGDRFRRQDVMVATYLVQSALMAGAAAALLTKAPVPLVYALAAAVATSITLTRPTQAALVATVARSPQEMVAANVLSGTIQYVSVLVGPVVAGLLLVVSSPGVVFAIMAAVLLWSAGLVFRIRGPEGLVRRRTAGARETVRYTLGGFRNLGAKPASRLLVGLLSVQSMVWGALDVLLVVLAIDLLRLGAAGVGLLNSALGAGGLVGSLVTFTFVGRRRLFPPFILGVVLWGIPLAGIALLHHRAAAIGLIAVAGGGRALMDVSGRTLLQRVVPNHLLARVFGVLEGLHMASLAVGSISAPALIAWLGLRGAFVAAGLVLPVVTLPLLGRLRTIDGSATIPERELALLRSIPMLAALPAPMIEPLAANLIPLSVPAGASIIREGETGDRFYIIRRGRVEVRRDGRTIAFRGPGEFFGEVALLRNVRRTADVVAVTDVGMYALDRDTFIEAVTGHVGSIAAADSVIDDRFSPPEG